MAGTPIIGENVRDSSKASSATSNLPVSHSGETASKSDSHFSISGWVMDPVETVASRTSEWLGTKANSISACVTSVPAMIAAVPSRMMSSDDWKLFVPGRLILTPETINGNSEQGSGDEFTDSETDGPESKYVTPRSGTPIDDGNDSRGRFLGTVHFTKSSADNSEAKGGRASHLSGTQATHKADAPKSAGVRAVSNADFDGMGIKIQEMWGK